MEDGGVLNRMRLWCLLVLAAVAVHALLPVAPPESRPTGSPFSPTTVDVATGESRRETATLSALADHEGDPLPLVALAIVLVVVLVAPTVRSAGVRLPLTRAPPPLRRATTPAQPRAPPAP